MAEVDITTPVPLDVIDPVSTALLKESEKLKTPAVFRDFSASAIGGATNDFLKGFDATHAAFNAALLTKFQKAALEEADISSPEFGNLLATFKGKNFPVSTELETAWARGDSGSDFRNQWLAALMQAMRQPIRTGELPGDFVIGETLRLVPLSGPDEPPALESLSRGTLAIASGLTTLPRAQAQFCDGFPQNEQPLARALAAVHPAQLRAGRGNRPNGRATAT